MGKLLRIKDAMISRVRQKDRAQNKGATLPRLAPREPLFNQIMTGNKSGLHPLTIAEFTFLPWPARQRFLHLHDGVLRHAPTIGGRR
jgi:hypothetical protein